ncbi:MAG: divalent-cation tolerance protein CutA [Pseudomonadota bacterium]
MNTNTGDDGAALVWCPYPDIDAARSAARMMLDERLIACANIIPGIESVFVWEGEVDSSAEVAVLFKTTANKLDRLVSRLGECHPYDTPAVLGWRCDAATPEVKNWLERSLG